MKWVNRLSEWWHQTKSDIKSRTHLGIPTASSIFDWPPPALQLLLTITMVAMQQTNTVVRGQTRHPAPTTINI